jgi:DNA polymerase III delta prime subunit
MPNFQKQGDILTKSARTGRLPHALLFYGQEKIGKRAFAVDLAKDLIGQNIELGTSPDFILLEPNNGTIQIKQIRELIDKLSFKPYSANFKIAIVDQAHLMNKEAQNCFLKFLEEPTEKTHLILVTAFPFLLLPTILSRVQKVRFFLKKGAEAEIDKTSIDDLTKLIQSDLVYRFNFAKIAGEKDLKEMLSNWTIFLRKIFISKLNGEKERSDDSKHYSINKLKDILNNIQETKHSISTTNANSRLALELLLLEL